MSALAGVAGAPFGAQTIASFVLHALWQAPLLAGAAALAIRVGRPQARVAHIVWAATLLLCVLMPVGATVAARRAALAAERESAVSVTYVAVDYAGVLPAMHRKPVWQRVLDRHFSLRDGVTPFAFTLPVRVARAVAAVYLLIALFLGLRLLVAWRRSWRLVDRAALLPEESCVAKAIQMQCGVLGVAAPPVRVSDEIAGPALAGAFHPTLLLPVCTEQMSQTEIEAVLAHELAHLRRHDPPVHLACSLLLVPVGFHPAVLWVARRVRQTREMACDAEAVGQMGSAARYARALLQVAERTGAGEARVARLGLFQSGLGLFDMGLGLFSDSLELTGGAMEERMQMMMNGNGSSSMAGRVARWSACVLVGGAALMTAAMVQVQPALAQAQQQQPIVVTVQKTEQAPQGMFVLEDEPQLVSGAHAQEQLRKAGRSLADAEAKATTDEDRKKIATARAVLGAAQEQLAQAGGDDRVIRMERLDAIDPQVRIELGALQTQLKDLKIDPQVRVEIRNLESDPKFRAQIEQQKAAGEKLRAEMESHRAEYEALTAKMNSPEFQATLRAQIDEAKKQMAAAKIDQAQMARMRKDAEAERVHAMAMLNSGELQRQMADAQQQVARANREIAAAGSPAGSDAPKSFFFTTTPDAPADKSATAPEQTPLKVDGSKAAGNIQTKTMPVYPPSAKEAHISGEVVLHVIIDETGKVESLQVVSSPDAALSQSAVEAVQQWTYKPYLLNGKPTPIDTTVHVHFSFGG